MQQNLFAVMRLRSPVALSYFDTGFELPCGRKDFLTAYLLMHLRLLLASATAIKTQSRTKLGPSVG